MKIQKKTKIIIGSIAITIIAGITTIAGEIKAESYTPLTPHAELHVQSYGLAAVHVGEKHDDSNSHFRYFHSVPASHLV